MLVLDVPHSDLEFAYFMIATTSIVPVQSYYSIIDHVP